MDFVTHNVVVCLNLILGDNHVLSFALGCNTALIFFAHICLYFGKPAINVCRINYQHFLFAMHPCTYRQLSLDHFDAEENFKTRRLSGKFYGHEEHLVFRISKQIYGHLYVVDVRY